MNKYYYELSKKDNSSRVNIYEQGLNEPIAQTGSVGWATKIINGLNHNCEEEELAT